MGDGGNPAKSNSCLNAGMKCLVLFQEESPGADSWTDGIQGSKLSQVVIAGT